MFKKSQDLLILASKSPRRKELLAYSGISFSTVHVEIDERLFVGEEPGAYVLRLAAKKAHVVSEQYPRSYVLAADTTVELAQASKVFEKPSTEQEAVEMLRSLSGCEHLVLTGFFLKRRTDPYHYQELVSTRVVFRELSDDEIYRYVSSGEPMDKAGAYAIQGGACGFVKEIFGSYTNVVGLPLSHVIEALRVLPEFK